MSENKSGPLFGIGGVTLLTVLLILCLTLFSVLALSSAQADLRLSEKNARNVSAYYAAEKEAFAIMGHAEALWPAGQPRPDATAFYRGMPEEYDLATMAEGDRLWISADIPVLDGAYLQVELYLGRSGGSRWEVRRWQLMPPTQDEADMPFLPLFIPQF